MITATDLFAGAGGSTTGATQAGARVVIAANHWRLAVDTHQANHPDTQHDCADISQVEPRRYPRTDLLLGSPECTWHSPASGRPGDASQDNLFSPRPLPPEAGERSRATMWDIPRFAEYHRYPIVIVENVVEAMTKWQPARAWLMAMDSLGYRHEVISHNAMHAQALGLPAPQSRDRVYVVFWDKKMPRPDWDSVQRPMAWCPRCDQIHPAAKAWKQRKGGRPLAGKYRAQYLYACTECGTIVEPGWLPAAAAIDWSLPAERIGDRARPLSEKTMVRIREGLRRYGTHVVEAAGNTYDSADPRHRQHGQSGAYMRAWPTTDPLRTLHTTVSKGLVLDAAHGTPIIRSTDEPLAAQTTSYTRSLLIPVEGRDGKMAASVLDPLRAQTTRNETALLMPYYGASKSMNPVSDPMGTLTTVDRYALVTLRGHNAPKPASHVLDTVAASGNHHGLMNVDEVRVEDCRFRMLEPHEITAGMAFPSGYVMLGTKRERVKMAGNGNPPPVERDLVSVAIAALGVDA